jgi:D-alanyl-D-alanine carboxypeptidase (penicillin-binding protein 5/6)
MTMMQRLLAGLLAALATLAAGPAAAQLPQPPEVAARNYLLLDVTSQQVLAERNADARVDPASLTKLMTAYLVFDALKARKITLEQTLPVSERAWSERKGGGSLMFIDPKMTPKVDELLKGMIAVSGNDAAVALAEGVGGSVENFVAMMNRQAQAWNLPNTQFKNVTGLTEPGHHSSARDMAVIASRILRDHAEYYGYYSMREYTFNKIRQDNRNLLLGKDPTVDGMKTGFTEAAGYCLIASATREFPNLGAGGKRRLLSVVLGTASRDARAAESQKLLNWGYTAWDAVRLFDAGKPVAMAQVWKGSVNQVALGAQARTGDAALIVSVPKGEADKIKTTIERTDPLVAPLAKDQRVGALKVIGPGGGLVAEVPLVVQAQVDAAGWLGRAWDSIRLWIK